MHWCGNLRTSSKARSQLRFPILFTSQHSINSFPRLFDAGVESEFCLWQLLMYGIDDAFEERYNRIGLPYAHYHRRHQPKRPWLPFSWVAEETLTSNHDNIPLLLAKLRSAEIKCHIWRQIQHFPIVRRGVHVGFHNVERFLQWTSCEKRDHIRGSWDADAEDRGGHAWILSVVVGLEVNVLLKKWRT